MVDQANIHPFHVDPNIKDLEADAAKMTPRGEVKKFRVPATME